jgi:hypothetical protein
LLSNKAINARWMPVCLLLECVIEPEERRR